MCPMPPFTRAACLLLPLLAACAGSPLEPDRLARPVPKSLIACDEELRGFVVIARVARLQGDNWTIFEPALQAMKDQVLDCIEESNREGVAI